VAAHPDRSGITAAFCSLLLAPPPAANDHRVGALALLARPVAQRLSQRLDRYLTTLEAEIETHLSSHRAQQAAAIEERALRPFDEDFFFDEDFLRGTLAPSFRASDSPIAIACFLLVTFFPDRPLFNVPFFRSCIAFSTFFDAFLLYLAMRQPPFNQIAYPVFRQACAVFRIGREALPWPPQAVSVWIWKASFPRDLCRK